MVSASSLFLAHLERRTHSGRGRRWRPQPGRRGARASWSGSVGERRTEDSKPSLFVFYTFAAVWYERLEPAYEPVFRAPASVPSGLAWLISSSSGILTGVTIMSGWMLRTSIQAASARRYCWKRGKVRWWAHSRS